MAGGKKGKGKRSTAKAAKAKAKTNATKRKERQAAPTRQRHKHEQFFVSKKGHIEEADRQIKIACDPPNNLTTQPDIRKFITNPKNKLDQKPLFIGKGLRSDGLGKYIRKVLRTTGGTILPRSGVAAWHAGINFGECECPEIVDVVLDGGEDASFAETTASTSPSLPLYLTTQNPTPPCMTDPHRFNGTRGHDQATLVSSTRPWKSRAYPA